MIGQRFTGDERTMTGQLVISNTGGDVNGYAELLGLYEEMKLRVNVRDDGSVITKPNADDKPDIG